MRMRFKIKNIVLLPSVQDDNTSLNDNITFRIARALSNQHVNCIVANWHDILILGPNVYILRGTKVTHDRIKRQDLDPPLKPDYVFYSPISTTQKIMNKRKLLSTSEFTMDFQFVRSFQNYNELCYFLLTEISKRNIPVSFSKYATYWGNKRHLQTMLSIFELVSREIVPRPKTWMVQFPKDKNLVGGIIRNFGHCILKPENKSRARGISILNQVNDIEIGNLLDGPYVIQELISEPFLFRGRKTDLRVHIVISDLKKPKYRLLSTVLLRSAPEVYVRGNLMSEICNTSYSKALGKRPIVSTLNLLAKSSKLSTDVYREIKKSIEDTVRRLMNAVAWTAMNYNLLPYLSIWGIDLLLRKTSVGYTTLVLEVNHYPQFYSGVAEVDEEIDNIFSEVSSHIFYGAVN